MGPCVRRIPVALYVLFMIQIRDIFAISTTAQIVEVKAEGRLGSNCTISCVITPPEVPVAWSFNDTPIVIDGREFTTSLENITLSSDVDGNRLRGVVARLHVTRSTALQHGRYACHAGGAQSSVGLDLALPARPTGTSPSPRRVLPSSQAIIYCLFEGFNLTEVKWRKDKMMMKLPPENQLTLQLNETHVNGSLRIQDISKKDNGTYLCGVRDNKTTMMVVERVDLLVLEKPQISIDFMKAVGAKKIYLNWTVNDGNSPVEAYSLQLRKNNTETWTYHSTPISAASTQFVVADLEPNMPYQLKIMAKNSQGYGQAYADPRWIKTLEQDPHFIPDMVVKGFTMSSVTVGWSPPPEPMAEYVHYYELLAREPGRPERADKEAVHSGNYRNLPYMFDNLTPDTSYIFRVRSCSELTKECGSWSPPVNGSTMDGAAGPCSNLTLTCRHDPVSGVGLLFASWLPPMEPNGKVIRYNVELFSNASFLNAEGAMESLSWGPKIRHVPATARSTRFDNMAPNTNFTVKISAVTRTKRPGEPMTIWCTTPPSTPPKDSLQGFRWDKVREYDGRWLFRLYTPRVSERNGAICCYRVFVVRMKNEQRLSDMPSPEHLTVSSYREVHNGKAGAGAYIAEIFTSDTLHSEVILGDGTSLNAANPHPFRQCGKCAHMAPARPTAPPTAAPTTLKEEEVVTEIVDVKEVESKESSSTTTEVPTTMVPSTTTTSVPEEPVETVEVSTDGAQEDYTSTEINESDKSLLLKKKNKIKRQFPTDESAKKLALQDLQEYQNAQPQAENELNKHQPMSSYIDSQTFTLDDDFYINRRISHQNKPEMKDDRETDENNRRVWRDDNENVNNNEYREESKCDDSNDCDEDDVVWTNTDEEGIEEFIIQPKDNDIERKRREQLSSNNNEGYLGHHKIVARSVNDDEDRTSIDKLEAPSDANQFSGSNKVIAVDLQNGVLRAHTASETDSVQVGPPMQQMGLYRRHAVWKRQVEDSNDFVKLMTDLAHDSPNQGRTEFNERLKKLKEQRDLQPPGEEGGAVERGMTILGADGVVQEQVTVTIAPNYDTKIFDGQLDTESNYTGFVELLVHSEGTEWAPVYSNYFAVLNPGPDDVPLEENYLLEVVLKVICGCVGVALLLVLAVCAVHAHNRRKAPHHGVEMNTLQTTLRNIYQGLRGGRHQLVSHSPPDMPPIAKDDLLAAYTERQNDSGYGFQHEFELLPDCFPDRTMEASEAKENQGKNRYPDIKAYDQTRVRLSTVDGVQGSDYINANIVLGYKERKRFVCAQGPTDVTVDDFWRMIWEHNLELVVMLTNLEEYSKVKCAKYWPDQQHSEKLYAGCIRVQHQGEKRYSDYIIRELRISKQPLSASNSQIIEANGVKKNGVGDMNNGNGNGNGTASNTCEERVVKQYHFLMWKDFVAPEHPHAILKFIKRVNEACSGGRTALVHCSAGVGRTGTLVALDCLLEQLAAEGHAAVFNTVCDLRRQRNFLVQSLKQYVFVYRALLEWATFGDTEIPANRLKSSVDRLRQTADNKDTCAMEEDFEAQLVFSSLQKVKQAPLEPCKPSLAGRAPEHMAKNRSEAVLPFDHNRVILAPIPTKEHSTYINASFIEGYDNSESYIIAQDPLPTTIADFWRMVSEQEISTIVMLSELGEGKCPRYWDDEEIQYEHISVSYLQSESCPYYTKREFQVTNTKNQERTRVTQLQYHGWPTVSGQVPEVTRGIIELVGSSGACNPPIAAAPPLLVHCSLGTDRSSMFVALSILITQLRTERRVDVSTVTRKMRTQRMGCLDTFLQYEFLHRAIVNYAELHNLLSDS